MKLSELRDFINDVESAGVSIDGWVEANHDVIYFPFHEMDDPAMKKLEEKYGLHYCEEGDCWAVFV